MARFDGILVEDQQIGGRFGGIPVGDEEPKAQSGVLDTIKQGILGSWDSFAQGANELNAGVGTFMQAPEANMLSGVLSANALASRKIRDWTGIDAGTDAAQETARSASAFAAEKRAENLRAGGALAIVGKAGETSGRSGSAYYQQQKDADAPEMVRQENAISDADGFWGTVKASAENPMGLTGTLARSLPDMAVGAGVAMKSARVAGALAEKSAIAAGAAPEVARAAGVAAAEKAASFSGIISEAASSGLHGREGSYQHVQNIPEQALAEIPRYKALLEQTGDKAKARDILANEIADQVPLLTSAGTAAGTIATNKMFGGDATAKTLAGGERMTAKDLGKRVAQDTVEEGIQGVPEDYVQHSALVQADPSHKFDLGSTLAQNMVAGLAMGAGGHGAGYVGENASRLRGQGNESSSAEPAPVGATPADSILGSLAPVTDAEKALYTPKNLTALDRVSEIDARLASGEQMPEDEATALADERATITAAWPQSVAGASTSFSTEAGARLNANYALMDVGDLTTSHDENLRSSPNYPAELQPRERERAASEMQVSGIVQKLDPARLGLSADAATGAPIVGADGLVESGNARTIALKRVYSTTDGKGDSALGSKAHTYREFLKTNAAQFGIAPESVDAMAKPVLVRVRSTPVNRAEFARQANASTVAQMSSSETAKSDADRMDVLDDLRPDANGDFSTSRDFIRRFMGKLPVTEQAGMLDAGGQLSQSGYTRIRNAVLAKAYGNSPVLARMVESMDDNLRNVGKALVAAAPSVAKARQAVAEGALFDTDITPDLMAAVEELSRIKDSGQSIDEALAQAGMFGDRYSAETRELIQFLADNMRRPRAIAEFIQAYMGALTAAGNPNQGSIFGDAAAPSKADLINVAKGKDNGSIAENPVGRQPSGAEGAGAEVGQRSADAQGGSSSAQGDEAANQEVDPQWRMFDKDSGTLGIPRANMPQVAIRLRPAMLAFMESKGISYEREDIAADEIKPTQAEYSLVKAERARNIADDRSDKSAVLVSSDGYVLDGHHRWVAKAQEKQPVNVIRFDAPIDRLLDAVREFSGTTTSNESGELLAKRTQAVERFYDAAGDLAQVLSKHTRAAIIPEQTPNLMPTLVKLFDAAFDIVGTDAKRATAWVKERLKALPEFRTKWNKILPETYRKAALQAAEQFDPNKHAQGSIFQAASSAAPAQGDMFRGGTAEKPAVAMIDGRPYDMKRGRAPAEETASETSSPVRASAPVEELGAAMEPTWDSFSAFWNGLLDGKGTIADVRDAFGTMLDRAEEMKASIGKLKNDQLKRMIGGWARPDDKKAELVKKVYEATIDRFTLNNSAPSKSWTYGEKMEVVEKRYQDQLRAIVDGLTDADLAAFRADVEKSTKERKEALDQKKAAVADPKRLADFDLYAIYNRNTGKTSQEARAALTAEQRATWDRLAAEKSRSERQNSLAERKSEVSVAAQTADGQIVETKHTKTGEGLFVVKAAERVERDVYNLWNSTAKRMGGWYSSFRGNGAVPGFQFKTRENADAFLKFLGGDKGQAQEVVNERRDAYADDRSQSAIERLTEMADRIEEAADQEMGRERKTNTNKRASQAASADAAARRAQAMAKTMRNIAASIDSGSAKFLDRVRQKVQIEMLQDFANTAKDVELRAKYPSYSDQEKHKGEPATSETAEHATWPTYTAFRSDLASLGRQLLGTDGTKKLGQRLLKVADDVTAAYKKFAEANLFKVSTFKTADGKPAVFRTEDAAEQAIARSGYVGKATTISFKRGEHLVIMGPAMARENNLWQGDDDKRITLSDEFGAELIAALGRVNRNREKVAVPWQFQSTYDRRKRLSQMSIETPAEFRSALREFINLRESPKEADKIKELERAMVGRRNDGLDFFPTPEGVAQEMIDAAEIEPGMSVLEPSAGMGHIAEMIRGAGVDPDVVEMANDRKELLEAKGFRVVGRDFMDMNPRSFTFGDTFKMEDGTEGVMRGLGGMGSNRVRLVVDGDERTAIYVDRDELTGVKKSGANSGYDRIIMNPPFSDRRDALHVQHAYSLLKPGGRLVAIMGEGVFNGQDKKAQAFREWLEEVGGSEEKLPEGSFLDPSLPVNTGVNARMVVIEKAGIESPSTPMLSTAETESRYSDSGLSRRGGGSMAMRDLKAVRDRVSAGMKNMPPVHVLEEPGQAPKTLRDHIEKVGAWNDVEGATHEGEIYLFASNMANEERAEFVLAQHEITHYGLRGKLGMGLDAALQNVWMNNSSVRKAASVLRSENRLSSNLEAVEEVLADMPSAELVALKGWRKMTANVRDWFAEHGFERIAEKLDRWLKSNMSDQAKADLYAADLVRAARGWVKSGKGHGKYAIGGTRMSLLNGADGGSIRGMADKDTVAGTQAPTSAGDGSTGSAKKYDQRWMDNDMTGLAERVKRVAYAEDDYRLPSLGNAVPASMVPKQAKQETVVLYRGVPTKLSDAKIRPGDWVAIDKKYAQEHGTGETGRSKVISVEVPADDVVWAGTDMSEYFYAPRNLVRNGERAVDALNRLGAEAFDSAGRSPSEESASAGSDVMGPRLSRSAALGQRAGVSAQTAAQRADAIIAQSAATIQPVDKLVKGLTQIARIDQGTTWVYNKVGSLLDRWTPEQIKAGFVADYGVPEAVIDRRVAMQGSMKTQLRGAGDLIDKLSMLTRAESRVAYEWMNNADPQAAAFFESQLPAESVKVMSDVKALVDKLSQEAVKLGQLDPEAFKSNRFEYLRRSYVKHTTELTKGESNSRQRSIAVLGDQYKGRGMTDSAPMAKIKNVAPEWWGRKLQQGKADKDLKGEKFIRLERRAPNGQGTLPLVTIQGPGNTNPLQKGRLLEVNYWPAGEPIPAKYSAWDQAGTWDVRDTKGGSLIMWRDFSKEERVAMGEIDEARYAIAKTLHGMIHDVETGRYLEWLAQRYAVKNAGQVPGRLVEASERMRDTFARGEWVQVPDSNILGTSVKKYGLLAGRYLPGPIWNDVRQMSGPRIGSDLWRSILGAWKTSKTALSPAVHTNNVMANFVMADWHDVTAGHILKALRLILAANRLEGKGKELGAGVASKFTAPGLAVSVARWSGVGVGDQEAAKIILDRFSDSGGNIGTWATAELQKEQLAPLLDALEKELGVAGQSPAAQVGVMVALQKMLQLKLPSAWDAFKPTKPGKAVTTEARNMLALYEAEDQFFRLAAWLKAKEDGATDMAAGKVARKSFLDYNINAPWVQIMRSTALPFVSFTYRAVPMLLETAATKPWKLMKLGMLAGALNLVGYYLSGGDEDDERKLLPEEKAGKIFGYHGDLLGMLDKKINVGLGPKLVRMPWNDSNSSPVFLDIRRFIPVGDVFDLAAGHSAIPLPPSMVPGGPLAVLAEIVLNRSQFTGKTITQETDGGAEQAGKVLDHFTKAFFPNLLLPNPVGYLAEAVTGVGNVGQTYAWTSVANAGKGKTDSFGREQSVVQAVVSSFGVKLGSYPKNVLRQNAQREMQFKTMEIERNIAALKREAQKKGIDAAEFKEKVSAQNAKKRAVIEDFQKRMSGG